MTATPPPNESGRWVRIDVTIEVDIHDPAALHLAAQRLDQTQATDNPEPHEAVRQRTSDTAIDDLDALLALLDPDAMVDGAYGVEIRAAEVGVYPADTEDRPDFAELFPANPDTETWQMTPRTAAVLHDSLSLLADWAFDDTEDLGDDPIGNAADAEVLGQLPRLTWNQDLQWRRQMARTFDDLAADLEAGHLPLPRCFGEEAALHIAMGHATDVIPEETSDALKDTVDSLPEHPDDFDWTFCSEMLFQDHDVLLLDDPTHDGIEDPHSEDNRTYGIGDLRPTAWFRPFNNVTRRDPHRGFRR